MSEIVKAQPQGSLTERMSYARALATANLLPPAYRNNPGNVLLAVEYGHALNIPPMTAIQGIHVIQGKPSLSADLMAAMVRRAGHRLRVRVDAGPVAVAELTRIDDDAFTYRCRWDMDRAKSAGLLGKDSWKNYPAEMLKARAISEVVREGASEVLHGMIYTADELGADATDRETDAYVVDETSPANVNTETGEITDINAAQDEFADDLAKQAVTASLSDGQRKKIGAMMRKLEITDRVKALEYVGAVIGHEISSRNDLTYDEAHAVIEALVKDAAAADAQKAVADVLDGEVVEEGDDS